MTHCGRVRVVGWLAVRPGFRLRQTRRQAGVLQRNGQFCPRGELSKLMNFHLAKPTGANQAELPIAYLKYFRLDRRARAALPASYKEFELFEFQL